MELVSDRLTANFRLSEFACGDQAYLSPDFINFVFNVVEPFRQWYNRPINVNSGYRTISYNRLVGGDVDSLHLRAMAIDFNFPPEYAKMTSLRKTEFLRNIRNKWFTLCQKAGGHGQMTVHDGWVHLGMSFSRAYYSDRRKYK